MAERIIKYSEALKEAADQMMSQDQSVYLMGLGVTYKNGAAGTTAGLKEKYPERVFDAPVSEAAITGMAVGAAISGLKPIVHHDRVEFSLFAADQIFTQAAKWNYMFGGNNTVPLVIRIVIGRQWGNGSQHSQAFYPLFGSVPGLKVVIPSTPKMAKGLLVSAIQDVNPVIILEPKWVYNIKQDVPEGIYSEPLDKAKVTKEGSDITLAAYGDGYIAAWQALELVKEYVDVELVDLVSLNPIDYGTIGASVNKTSRLLCVDTTHKTFGVGSEIIAHISQNTEVVLKNRPVSLACPNVPCPTSTSLSEQFYPTKVDIANAILKIFDKPTLDIKLSFEEIHMAPQDTIL